MVMLKNIWASKVVSIRTKLRIFNSNVVSSALRIRNMEDNEDDAAEDPDISQHLSEAHLQHPMAREDPERRAVGASGAGTSGQADLAEEVGLHPAPHAGDMEPAGEKEERPASQQLEAGD
nr:hypothetical protein BaRGS_027389 [Batillaria attramentaria]